MLIRICLFVSLFHAISKAAEDADENVGTVIGIDLGTTYSWYGTVV